MLLLALSIVTLAAAAGPESPPTTGESPAASASPAPSESAAGPGTPDIPEPPVAPRSLADSGPPATSEPPAASADPLALAAPETSSESKPPAEPELVDVPVDLSLVPPISLNGHRHARNYLSLGLGAARSGRLDGFGFAPLHWTDGAVNGVQVGWAAAVAGDLVRGAQVGGVSQAPKVQGLQTATFVSLAQEEISGLQASGLTAIATGSVEGVQASGLFNWAEEIDGLQASGIAAITTGHVAGLQASGVFNQADSLDGLQASVVNRADTIAGMQIAVVNLGRSVHGGQIGLVNIASEVEGAQVGLFNYAKSADASVGLFSWVGNGTHDVELFATEFSLVNAALRFGGKNVYGLLVGGLQPAEREEVGERRWTFGAGVGTRIGLSNRFRLDIDLLAQNVQYGEPYDTDDGENVLGTLRVLVGLEATPWLAAFAGPTLSVYSAKEENPDIDLGKKFDLWGGSRAWVGFAGGLRF